MKRYRHPPFSWRAFSSPLRIEFTIRFARASGNRLISILARSDPALRAAAQLLRIIKVAEEVLERGRYVALPAPISDCVKAAPLGLQNPTEKRQIGLAAHEVSRLIVLRDRAQNGSVLDHLALCRCQVLSAAEIRLAF